ncbi:MAG TPA: radical SAM protein [Candidatus Polarisedimenticolia bacterium]|nr:radical SAM protein [Candidatus Polarisedimenticolia bacterium]
MSCAEASYNTFGSRLMAATGRARVPLSGSLELTFRCNLRCVHCYIPDFSGRGEMTTAEIRRILDETADAGCLWMLLTGGEVLSRADFPEIYRHAKGRGMLLTVFTNGTLLDDRIADLFAEYPPLGVEITLYGMSDDTYLRTTGMPGRFRRVREAVERLHARRVKLTLKAVAMQGLVEELPTMRAWADSLGLPFRYDGTIHGRLDGSMQPVAARATPSDIVGLDAADPERRAHWQRFYDRFVRTTPKTDRLLSCGAGLQSFHVDPRGWLWSCEALPLDGYDLRNGSFLEGWNGVVGAVRERPAAPENVCVRCELKSLCDRCPATAILETGSPDGWIPHFCELTHRRAALLEGEAGDPARAARFLAHADKVASGWTPEGVTLPRASRRPAPSGAGTACAAGGCATGCSKTARPSASQSPNLLSIERPSPAETAR